MAPQRNTLYYGDNLSILRQYVADESVDLVYLDPPFNSNRNYNVLFKNERGQVAESQVQAFTDTWHWGESAERAFHDLMTRSTPEVAAVMSAFRQFLGTNQMMAYIAMMGVRFVELHRILKPTGSLYLHCDPTASHYLKVVLDTIFGAEMFKNEVVWKRHSAHSSAKRYGPVHDIILFYSKAETYQWTYPRIGYEEGYLDKYYKYDDGDGRLYWRNSITAAGVRRGSSGNAWRGFDPSNQGAHWKFTIENLEKLDAEGKIYWPPKGGWPQIKRYRNELKGIALSDLWDDIDKINPAGNERLGYPTQKPLALLERILAASSNEGDTVLDPFCGCGTTIAAAQKLNRRWIGIDITHLSVALQKYRLRDSFDQIANRDYDVLGEPVDLAAANQLAQDNRYQFQWWALSLIQARPIGGEAGQKKGKKGADQGIDGVISFFDDPSLRIKNVLLQVKSGKVSSRDIRDLRGVLDREGSPLGVFITLEPPSAPMIAEAASMGFYHSPGWQRNFPRLQIFTIEELLDGRKPELPNNVTFARSPKEQRKSQQQADLFMFQDTE